MTTYDVVLRGGRVIDPETGLDAIADVAITGGRIAEIGTALASAPVDLSVAGHVVTAGFIDLHSHTADIPGLGCVHSTALRRRLSWKPASPP